MPYAYRDTPLADVLPVVCDGPAPPPVESLREPYRPRLTPAGQSHPLFRFSTEDAKSAEIWNRLPPLYWYARGYRRKLSAEVLAVHPNRPGESEPGVAQRDEYYPLILQQFVGAGRVLFIGFDDTWRWRFREERSALQSILAAGSADAGPRTNPPHRNPHGSEDLSPRRADPRFGPFPG